MININKIIKFMLLSLECSLCWTTKCLLGWGILAIMIPINVVFWLSEPNDKYRGGQAKFVGMSEIYTAKFWSFMRKINYDMLFKNGRPKVCATNFWAAATIGMILYIVPASIEDEEKFREIAVKNYMRDIAPHQRF